jgi:hypothetical protein
VQAEHGGKPTRDAPAIHALIVHRQRSGALAAERRAHPPQPRCGGEEEALVDADVALVQRRGKLPGRVARRLVRFVEDAQVKAVTAHARLRLLRSGKSECGV